MNTSQVQGSEQSIEISSSEPTLHDILYKFCDIYRKTKKNRSPKEKVRYVEYKEKLEKALNSSEKSEQMLREREHELSALRETVEEKNEQIVQLNQLIKDLESKLLNIQDTPKPQRVTELAVREFGSKSELHKRDSFHSNLPIHSTPKTQRKDLQKNLTVYSEATANNMTIEQLMDNFTLAKQSHSKGTSEMDNKYYNKIIQKMREMIDIKNNLENKAA